MPTAQRTVRTRMALIGASVFLGVTLSATSPPATASMNPPLVPEMLVGINGSSIVYDVSTSIYFESNNPAACAPNSCFDLLRTNDNGLHFSILTLPPIKVVDGSPLGNLNRVIFANPEDGYAILNTPRPSLLYVTTNGAESWQKVVIAPGVTITGLVTTKNTLYAVITTCSKSGSCTDYRLARSPLGARHWTFSPLAMLPKGMGVGLGAYGSTVWLTRQTQTTVLLYTSHNAGRTFTRSRAPDLGSVYACSMTAMSTQAIWAECPTGMEVSFFYSGDAGATWNRILPAHGFGGTGGGTFDPVSSTVAYIDYGDSNGPKNLYRITNEGRTGTAVAKLRCNIDSGLVFTDARNGLVACDAKNTNATTYLMRTTDGGVTWTKISDSPS